MAGAIREEHAFQALLRDYENGKIEIGVNTVKYNQAGAPFHRPWDNGLPALIIAGLVIWNFSLAWEAGAVSLGCGVLFFFFFVGPWVLKRVRKRVLDFALSSSTAWQELWDEGGLSIRRGSEGVFTPRDDWSAFVLDQPTSAAPQPDADGWITLGPDAHVTRLRPREKL